jgi:hypothetical protein
MSLPVFSLFALCAFGVFLVIVRSDHPGRTMADVFAIVLCIAGVLGIFAGVVFLVDTPNNIGRGLGAPLFWSGLVILVLGVILSRTASRKTCPQCAERVKLEANKCRHCGQDFSAA